MEETNFDMYNGEMRPLVIIIAKTKRAKVGVTNTNLVHKISAV